MPTVETVMRRSETPTPLGSARIPTAFDDLRQVQQGFTHSHENQVEPRAARHVLPRGYRQHLPDDFTRGQIALCPQQCREAKPAVEGAANLARQAERGAVLLRHVNGFDQVAVLEAEKVADGAVTRGELALDFRIDDPVTRRDGVAEIAVKIGEPGKVANATDVDPVVDLPPSISRLAETHREILQFFQVEPEKVAVMFFNAILRLFHSMLTLAAGGSRFPEFGSVS